MNNKMFFSLIIGLIFSVMLIGCEENKTNNQSNNSTTNTQVNPEELLFLHAEIKKLQRENASLEEKVAALESELSSMSLDENHIVIDKTIDPTILEVIFKHFEAIKENDELKYKETLLNPDYTNSTWTWDFANDKDITYTITKLTNSGIGSPAVDCSFEFQDALTGAVISMTPTFMLSETEEGYKIYDID